MIKNLLILFKVMDLNQVILKQYGVILKIKDYLMLQYDMIFGSNFARERFFPGPHSQS